ncbi:TetR/AcrR family transcriptional regulator [Amycolatopsis vancoresmycina]|uniref:TetR family transcriptional regulator n=1 Tax=Amycolatopsis vancoresmycina DSM 44592 TaxID=1292037 RepID=R1HWX8_9PSEU|nr:TetR/AcrR family transcriptional regulator [Amycolatopsis vancoresmycina]EOD68030.1 TetR family transcriptional regulator [Amycolatopsis vancoresmycina DSM 44592]
MEKMRADARRNRAKVLAAAEEAFALDGLAVPLDDIARLAGVGAGTVYRHFPSKEALFQAVVLERIQQFAEEARALVTAADDPGAVFFDYFVRVIRQASLNRAICDALAESSGHAFKAGAGDEFRAALAELLARAQAAGAVRPDIDGDDLRALIVGCLAVERYAPGSEHLLRVVVDGLRPVERVRTG